MSRNYRELRIWQEAHKLTLELDKLVEGFPSKEQHRLIDQIQRASASIAANIVESCGQNSTAAVRRYLFISHGSIQELSYHLLLSHDLSYIDTEKYEKLAKRIDTLGKMTYGFILKMPNKTKYLLARTDLNSLE